MIILCETYATLSKCASKEKKEIYTSTIHHIHRWKMFEVKSSCLQRGGMLLMTDFAKWLQFSEKFRWNQWYSTFSMNQIAKTAYETNDLRTIKYSDEVQNESGLMSFRKMVILDKFWHAYMNTSRLSWIVCHFVKGLKIYISTEQRWRRFRLFMDYHRILINWRSIALKKLDYFKIYAF